MTIFAAIVSVVTTAVGLMILILMGLGISRNATETAADQAALAGAGRALAGPEHACAVAERVAAAHNSSLVKCDVDQLVVWVSVERPISPALTPLLTRLGIATGGLTALSHAEQPFRSL
jgi:secretion/DNA translocation related TadE-like protein